MSTVLVVEDHEPTRVLVTALCRRLGLDVEVASDGARALEMIRTCSYDAVLLDLLLPKVNGGDVLRELRLCAPSLVPRTILMTAASDAALRDFDGTGTLALLRKPFEISDLSHALLACCEPAPALAVM